MFKVKHRGKQSRSPKDSMRTCLAGEHQCSERFTASKSHSAFPCFSLRFCPWVQEQALGFYRRAGLRVLFLFPSGIFTGAVPVLCDLFSTATIKNPKTITKIKTQIPLCCLPIQCDYPRLSVPRTLQASQQYSGLAISSGAVLTVSCALHEGPPFSKSTRKL